MGKRGPVPRGEFQNKSRVLSTRIREDTRTALEAAAQQSGRSLSQEIELRLRRSLFDDSKLIEVFGSRRNYALLRVIGGVIESVFNPDDFEKDWTDDPYAFDQVLRSITAVLEALRPPGAIPDFADDPAMAALAPIQGITNAANVLHRVQTADPGMPIESGGNKQDHILGLLKADLGTLADRPVIVRGTAADFRRKADELDRRDGTDQPEAAPEKPKRTRKRK